jgi:hypothetical protein
MAQNIPIAPSAAVAVSTESPVDWGAILAGAVVALAISFVLLAFGSALGLSLGSVEAGEGVSLAWISIASGVWFIWVAVSAFAAGGYAAGRLRRTVGGVTADEVETRDGAHGVVVWAIGTLLAAVLAANGIGGVTSAAGRAAGAATEAAAEAVDSNYDAIGSALLRTGTTPASAGDIDGAQIGAVLSAAAEGDGLPESDRAWLTESLAARTGLAPDEAESRIDAALAEAQDMREAAVDAAETARVAAAIAAFVIAATLMAGAAASYFGATAGGHHRDEATPFRTFGRR